MVWLALLLVAVVVLDVLQRQRSFALVALLTAVGFALSLALLNVDTFIVRQNVARYGRGEVLDVGYLASLSPDAIPVMVDLYQSPSVEQATRDRLGAALACYHFQADARTPDQSWQSFHLSNYRAETALGQVLDQLNAYRFENSTWPSKVISPQGLDFECYSYTSY
jgi:hypothetical protein